MQCGHEFRSDCKTVEDTKNVSVIYYEFVDRVDVRRKANLKGFSQIARQGVNVYLTW